MNLLEDVKYLTDDNEEGVTNYLVSLYERTENKYKYYPTKLNRLLTIYKLCTLKYNDWCLRNGFIINEDRTMGMPRWTYSAFYNDYSLIEEDKCEITDNLEIFDEQKCFLHPDYKTIYNMFAFNKDYEDYIKISDDSKELLELIFRKFGNYSSRDLAPLINDIVSKIPIKKRYNKNYIDFEDFKNFLLENKKTLKDNAIFEFINDFDRLKISKSIEKKLEQKKENSELQTKIPEVNSKINFEKKYPFFISKFKNLNSNQQNELIDYLIELSNSNNSCVKTKSIKKK